LGDAAATGGAGVGDEVFDAWEFWETVSCLLHIEKLSAKSNGTIAKRIIIKVVRL